MHRIILHYIISMHSHKHFMNKITMSVGVEEATKSSKESITSEVAKEDESKPLIEKQGM